MKSARRPVEHVNHDDSAASERMQGTVWRRLAAWRGLGYGIRCAPSRAARTPSAGTSFPRAKHACLAVEAGKREARTPHCAACTSACSAARTSATSRPRMGRRGHRCGRRRRRWERHRQLSRQAGAGASGDRQRATRRKRHPGESQVVVAVQHRQRGPEAGCGRADRATRRHPRQIPRRPHPHPGSHRLIGIRRAQQELSLRRAEAVRDALASRGVNPRQMLVEGVGAARPIADNATAEGRAENRRVELHIDVAKRS